MESARIHRAGENQVNQLTQWGPVAVIVAGYLLGIYFQNRRIDDLRDSTKAGFAAMNIRFDAINERFDDMRDLWRAELGRVEEVLDTRLKHLERP
jgi:hypothetical protein